MTRLLVLYYSTYGHVETLAAAVAEGARSALLCQVGFPWGIVAPDTNHANLRGALAAEQGTASCPRQTNWKHEGREYRNGAKGGGRKPATWGVKHGVQ